MTSSELKQLYEFNNPAGYFFNRRTTRFFGDTMSNFSVRDGGRVKSMAGNGIEEVEVWELVRRRPVNGGLHGHCAYFRKDNGQEVYNHA